MLVRISRNVAWQKSIELSRWLVPVLSFYFIWLIVVNKSASGSFAGHWNAAFESSSVYFIPFMLTLTACNIFLESLKWKTSLRGMISLSMKESLEQTFMSMAAGFITPFRSGALFARFITNEKTEKFLLLNATIRMAVAQFTITFLAGMLGLIYWLYQNNFNEEIKLACLSVFVIALAVIVYLMICPVEINFRNRKWSGLEFDIRLMFFSLVRYAIFTFQYILLLWFFGAEIEFMSALSLVSMTYLVNTLLPAGILGKLGIRELSGILIIGESTGFTLEVSCAAFFIWILNQALPAITGSGFFLARNFRIK